MNKNFTEGSNHASAVRMYMVLASLFAATAACDDGSLDPPSAPASEQLATGSVDDGIVGYPMPRAAMSARRSVLLGADPDADHIVLPNLLALEPGDANNVFPHARPNMRYQQIFLGSEVGGPGTFDQLCLRPDDVIASTSLVQQLTVKMGPTTRDLQTIGPVFDANYSEPPVTVFSGEFDMPETGPGGLDDWSACVDFTARYEHHGGNLIVELINTSTEFTNSWTADFCWSSFGQTCKTTRLYAFNAGASQAQFLFQNQGLAMRLGVARTPIEMAEDLQVSIRALEAEGVLNRGQSRSLIAKLDQVVRQLERQNEAAAANLIRATIREIEALGSGGILAEDIGGELVDEATALLESL